MVLMQDLSQDLITGPQVVKKKHLHENLKKREKEKIRHLVAKSKHLKRLQRDYLELNPM